MENTKTWDRYIRGQSFQARINLLVKADKNERFYAGDQWNGVKSNGLPTPVFNVLKRVIDYKVAMVVADQLTLNFSAENTPSTPAESAIDPMTPNLSDPNEVAQVMTDYAKTQCENLKQDMLDEEGLLDAALSGDMVVHYYWDSEADTGQKVGLTQITNPDGTQSMQPAPVMGELKGELIDNINWFPGNPNSNEVDNQPYHILAFRKMVEDLKKEALANGVPQEVVDSIKADADYNKQAGDRGKIELDSDDAPKCTVLLQYREQDGHILALKTTQNVDIKPEFDTGLTEYPLAVMNWHRRKNSCYGEAEATMCVPNQIAINKLAAMIVMWSMMLGFPKPVYDRNRIPTWNADIGAAQPVDGDVTGVAMYLQPGQLPAAVDTLFEKFISLTKEMLGANETALGDTSITKTAAGIIALQKAVAMPLTMIKKRYYQYKEDVGNIWYDFWRSKYQPGRQLSIKRNNQTIMVPYGQEMQDTKLKLKVDVGPSTQWSEVQSIQSLDNLLNLKYITLSEYLERLPNGLIPDKQKLIDSRQQQIQDQTFVYEQMAKWIEQQPPYVQAQLEQLRQKNPQEYEQMIKKMMGGNQNGMPSMQTGLNGSGQQVQQPAG